MYFQTIKWVRVKKMSQISKPTSLYIQRYACMYLFREMRHRPPTMQLGRGQGCQFMHPNEPQFLSSRCNKSMSLMFQVPGIHFLENGKYCLLQNNHINYFTKNPGRPASDPWATTIPILQLKALQNAFFARFTVSICGCFCFTASAISNTFADYMRYEMNAFQLMNTIHQFCMSDNSFEEAMFCLKSHSP